MFKIIIYVFIVLFTGAMILYAEEQSVEQQDLSPKDMIIRAWEAWGAKDQDKAFYWTNKCIEMYSEEAKKEQASLNDFPATDSIDQYEALGAVGTSFFIQGEAYLSLGKIEEAKDAFGIAIKDYSFAQNWDPRGWYWSVKEKSQASVEKSEEKPDAAEE
ncbi:MAG: hypothetical protein Q8N76_05635, partial [Candidatus Omnitrophota bacterium]|nr:hypothetical protein [Candidatus Omnitrophota bacterium]